MKISDKKIEAYVLKNALSYSGKASQGAVISALFNEGLKKEEIKDYSEKISEIIKKTNSLSLKEQQKKFENLKYLISLREQRIGLQELPNTQNGVVMRFAPSPSGALHVGHAVTSCLSYDYVKKYSGKFIFRIEDTNPENIYEPAYELLTKDVKWLFNNEAQIVIQSDRMDLYYSYAASLIEKNSAYVCTCSGDEFRELINKKQPCPCRKKTIKKNIFDWEKMLRKNGFKEGEAVLRFKTPEKYDGVKNKNPAMRDFPLARINESSHPRQKNKYKVWPLMNLSVAVDDIEMKMTHIIRAKEHRDNAERQKMIFEVFDEPYPWTFFLGRIHLKGMRLSASEITKGVIEKKYSGWDDKKLMTVSSLKKQGYKPVAFWKLAEHIGLSEVDKTIEQKEFFNLLNTFNKSS